MNGRKIANILILLLSFFAGALIFIWLLLREGPAAIAENLFAFGIWPFVGFVVLSLLNFILYSWRWQLIINRQVSAEQRLPLHRVYLHRMSGFAMSYLTPAAQVGGEPVRVAMLASDKVPLRHATSAVVLDIAFELVAYIAFIVAGVLLALWEGLGDGQSFTMILLGLAVVLLVLIGFFWSIAAGHGFFSWIFRRTGLDRWSWIARYKEPLLSMEGMMTRFLRGKPGLIVLVSVLSLAVIGFRVVEVFYLMWFFGISVTFGQAFLIGTLPGIALLLPVPAGVGVFEGGFSAVFVLLGISLQAVAFALIIRSRDLVFIFIGLLHMTRQGGNVLRRRLARQRKSAV